MGGRCSSKGDHRGGSDSNKGSGGGMVRTVVMTTMANNDDNSRNKGSYINLYRGHQQRLEEEQQVLQVQQRPVQLQVQQ